MFYRYTAWVPFTGIIYHRGQTPVIACRSSRSSLHM